MGWAVWGEVRRVGCVWWAVWGGAAWSGAVWSEVRGVGCVEWAVWTGLRGVGLCGLGLRGVGLRGVGWCEGEEGSGHMSVSRAFGT